MWWTEAWNGAINEFSDLQDPVYSGRLGVRLLMAVALGAVLGYDRERHDRPAGLRTHILVALGAALFVIVALRAGFDSQAMGRVVQGLITGVGFLGAGAIIKLDDRREIRGLTTAAGIWVTAAIGMTVGLGQLATATAVAALAWIVLAVLPAIEPSSKQATNLEARDREVRDATPVASDEPQ